MIHVQHMIKGRNYKLRVGGYSPNPSKIMIQPLNRKIKADTHSWDIQSQWFSKKLVFKAQGSQGSIFLSTPLNSKNLIRLFIVEIVPQ
jgi:hypothetical protein